jgi:hypothetical protein
MTAQVGSGLNIQQATLGLLNWLNNSGTILSTSLPSSAFEQIKLFFDVQDRYGL